MSIRCLRRASPYAPPHTLFGVLVVHPITNPASGLVMGWILSGTLDSPRYRLPRDGCNLFEDLHLLDGIKISADVTKFGRKAPAFRRGDISPLAR